MGRRGPKPKPTAIKLREGNPGKRPLNADEPRPAVELPEPPDFLCALAQAHWRELGPLLEAAGLVTRIDSPAMQMLCATYAEWRLCVVAARHEGPLVEDDKGVQRINPLLLRADKRQEAYRKLIAEFGLSPAARSRLSVKPPAGGEPADDGGIDAFLRIA